VPPERQYSVPEPEKSGALTYEIFPEQPATPHKPLKKLTPLPSYQLPLVAIIVDDIGYDRRIARQLLDLDVPLTFSILPQGPFNKKILAKAQAKGLEIMLHLPMEPNEFPKVNPGPGALLSDMAADEFIAQLIEDIDRLPGIVGVNNHMGSRISASPERMRQILSTLKARNLFFIDSRTTAETVAKSSAQLLQVPFAERDIFIDHLDNPDFIHSQLERLIERAQNQGYAVGIAHPHPATVDQLRAFLPRLKAEVTLVSASVLVNAVTLAESQKVHTAYKEE
jgi:polysaccharide deacetylase 2 family uncharacterized protein YibQ